MENSTQLKAHIMSDILQIKNTFYAVQKDKIKLIDTLLNINFHFPINSNSGVYKIVFEDGSYYIGKSGNIVKRIWEHLCETINIKYNQKFYKKLKANIKSKKEIYVLKLSNKQEKEMEFLKLHLNIDENLCFNVIGNNRINK